MNNRCRWLALVLFPVVLHAQAAEVKIKDPSPDGKFALRAGREEGDMFIIEKATGKRVQKLDWMGNPSAFDARLHWSADSQRVAHEMPHRRSTEVSIFFRKGNAFEEIQFPENMPHPELPTRINSDKEAVYFKSWSQTNVMGWLKSGNLRISYFVEDEIDQRDEITITFSFDKKHVAHVVKEEAFASHYVIVGDNLELDGSHELAIKAYTQALAVDPKNVAAFVNRGVAKEASGQFESALADYDRALKIDPKNSKGLFSRANARIAKGDLDGAIADETVIIESDPDSAYWASMERGGIFYMRQEWAKALSDFRRPIGLHPDNSGHAYLLAWIARVKLGEKEAADKELAAGVSEKHLDGWDLESALAGYVLGEVTEQDLLKTAENTPAKTYPNVEAWFLIGFKQALAGDKKRAAEAFNKCLAAAKEKLPPNFWLPPEARLAALELKALEGQP
jgi:tetratricopeptide (TPR) repeat protein